jgi:hypothetical protein
VEGSNLHRTRNSHAASFLLKVCHCKRYFIELHKNHMPYTFQSLDSYYG